MFNEFDVLNEFRKSNGVFSSYQYANMYKAQDLKARILIYLIIFINLVTNVTETF